MKRVQPIKRKKGDHLKPENMKVISEKRGPDIEEDFLPAGTMTGRLTDNATRGPDSIIDLEEGLRIDEHELDQAWVGQPETFYRVAKRYQLFISQRDAKKQELAEVEARADLEIRETAAKQNEKVTETEVKGLVRLDRDVARVAGELLGLMRQLGSLSALKEAFEQRGKALDGLTKLYLANYYGANTDGSNAARSMLREGSSNRVREQLKGRRQRYDEDDD